ncbi:hypothetical protein P8C59_007068 [Phyllachora maydis]|uniref:Uncharacterized protein n=1 Tax=Phyllachora maydis TaxID=1825666 RepID=A0AAD9I7Z3_9PEZI|nr:hypothetical protein P8C59_007068 [Phyllachora maydis]
MPVFLDILGRCVWLIGPRPLLISPLIIITARFTPRLIYLASQCFHTPTWELTAEPSRAWRRPPPRGL